MEIFWGFRNMQEKLKYLKPNYSWEVIFIAIVFMLFDKPAAQQLVKTTCGWNYWNLLIIFFFSSKSPFFQKFSIYKWIKRLPKIWCNGQITFFFYIQSSITYLCNKIWACEKKCWIHYSIRRVINKTKLIHTYLHSL